MDWTIWREIINFSTPLAGIVAVAWALFRSGRWTANEIIKPLLGKDGALPEFLKCQQEESEKQTAEMSQLRQAITEASNNTNAKLDKLIEVTSQGHVAVRELRDDIRTLLVIHRHWVSVAGQLSREDPAITVHLEAIREIAERYIAER